MTYVNNFIFMCENLLSVVVREKTNIPMFWFYYKLRFIYTNHHIYRSLILCIKQYTGNITT